MKSEVLELDMSSRLFLDLTGAVREFAAKCGGDGLVQVFVPHATAGIALMETGSGSEEDLETTIERVLPRDQRYVHSHGSPGHGADHVLPAFISPSLTVPVLGGDPQLGTWQSVVLVDTNRDNPRRKVRLSFIPA
jgi:secondary thiamine-phosphate synthase enzyme